MISILQPCGSRAVESGFGDVALAAGGGASEAETLR